MLGSCTIEPPFERVNPLDPESIYDLGVTGPDSAHFIGQQLTFAITSDPALPMYEIPIVWDVLSHISCDPPKPEGCALRQYVLGQYTGDETVRIIDAAAYYRDIVVTVNFDSRAISKRIHVGQRIGDLTMTCSRATVPVSSCAGPIPIGADIVLTLQATDIGGAPAKQLFFALPRIQLTSRNLAVLSPIQPVLHPSVASVRFTPVGPGSTWAIVRMDDAIDSVFVTIAP